MREPGPTSVEDITRPSPCSEVAVKAKPTKKATGHGPRKVGRFWMEDDMIDLGLLRFLGGSELKVYVALRRFADKKRRVTISQPRLAELLGCDKRTVGRAIKGLRSHGFLDGWQIGFNRSNHYVLKKPREVQRANAHKVDNSVQAAGDARAP